MAKADESPKGFCEEHGVQCFKVENMEKELKEINERLKSVVTKDEIKEIVVRLEEAIDDLKNADKHHYKDIGLIQQSIAAIHETLSAYKEAQTEMKADYKNLLATVNNIYQLLQDNAANQVKQAMEQSRIVQEDAKLNIASSNFLQFLLKMFNKRWFVVLFCFIIMVLIPLVFQHHDDIIKILSDIFVGK